MINVLLLAAFTLLVTILAILPVLLFLKNEKPFHRAPLLSPDARNDVASIGVSVCIPARNEEKSIAAALDSLSQSQHKNIEILVLDDHSEDETKSIVETKSLNDPRIRLIESEELPRGWNGKQHACFQLSNIASKGFLLFLDADVRLTPDAIERCIAFQSTSGSPLISGFPRQQTMTLSEKILIPMMHYVLLCFLPIDLMRKDKSPGFAAGCGQLFFAETATYRTLGGHSQIFASRHDGIQLPRAYRKAGHSTDLFDATDIATCRMYENVGQVQRGLLKNATEGIANAKLIVPFTILLLGGTLAAPAALIVACASQLSIWLIAWFALLSLIAWIPRSVAAIRFHQSRLGAVLHPIAIVWFVSLQWIALIRSRLGYRILWRGRN